MPSAARTARILIADGREAPMRYVHPPPESALDHRYDCEWKILETALERTRASHREDQARFAAVRTLDDLRRFSIGLGLGWIDIAILRANGFNVIAGSSYEGLFSKLQQRGRERPRSAARHRGAAQPAPRRRGVA